jgi:hypothetical protein
MSIPLGSITVHSQVQKLLHLILKKVTFARKAGKPEVILNVNRDGIHGIQELYVAFSVESLSHNISIFFFDNTVPKKNTLIYATSHLERSVISTVMHNIATTYQVVR